MVKDIFKDPKESTELNGKKKPFLLRLKIKQEYLLTVSPLYTVLDVPTSTSRGGEKIKGIPVAKEKKNLFSFIDDLIFY